MDAALHARELILGRALDARRFFEWIAYRGHLLDAMLPWQGFRT